MTATQTQYAAWQAAVRVREGYDRRQQAARERLLAAQRTEAEREAEELAFEAEIDRLCRHNPHM